MEYRVCNRCIMDTSDPDIVFDDKGMCNHCRRFFFRSQNYMFDEQPEKLRAVLEKVKRDGEGKRYDCVIGLSGGVDSSYLA